MFYRLKQLILAIGDLVALYAGLYAGVALRYLALPDSNFTRLLTPLTELFVVAVLVMFIIGLYDVGRARNNWPFFQKVLLTAAIWFGISVLYFYGNPRLTVSPKTTLLLTTAAGFAFLSLWRAVYNRFLSRNILRTPVIFVGFNKEIRELLNVIMKNPERGFVAAGIVCDHTVDYKIPNGKTLEEVIKLNNGYPGVIVTSEHAANKPEILGQLYQALYKQVSIIQLADFYEEFFRRIPPFTFTEDWFITHLREQTRKMYDRFRILADVLIAFVTGAFFVVTFPFIAVIIKITSPGPIFFSQDRVGKNGQVFKIIKYRTMKALDKSGSAEIQGPQFAAIKDPRITAFGKFMRKTRLDEIPQFWNILRGEMAVIGPRPERPEFVEVLVGQMPFYSLRHLVKPGITGWAQLQASYYGTIEENLVKLQYDLYYIKNRGPILDLAILLRTISVLLRFMGR
jgi:exopolysaccharide biosynthesis polyprenyl glycosylphosphotransferase